MHIQGKSFTLNEKFPDLFKKHSAKSSRILSKTIQGKVPDRKECSLAVSVCVPFPRVSGLESINIGVREINSNTYNAYIYINIYI